MDRNAVAIETIPHLERVVQHHWYSVFPFGQNPKKSLKKALRESVSS
jgi:hypothetical protein